MFFSFLFKGKKGNTEKVEKTLFNTAVVANIVGLSLACLVLLLGAYRNFVEFYKYAGTAVIMIVLTYILILILAALSSSMNRKEQIVKTEEKKEAKSASTKKVKTSASTKKSTTKKKQK